MWSFYVIADASTALTILSSEGGLIAVIASAATALVMKLVDFAFKRQEVKDKGLVDDIARLRSELIEEASQLRENARKLDTENVRFREQYFEAREELTTVRGEKEAMEFSRDRYRDRYKLLQAEASEIIQYVQEMGLDEQDEYLQTRLESLNAYFTNPDESSS